MDVAIPAAVGRTTLRRVTGNDGEFASLVGIYADAYTVLELDDAEKRGRFESRLRKNADAAGTALIAAYRGERLVGVMRWHDYTMRLRTTDVFAGGLGAVAVAVDARRSGVGADLVRAFVTAYRARGAAIALLHPFRHDFYRRMGFGHGTKMNRYRFAPEELPESGAREGVQRIDAGGAEALAACYERVRARTNGLIVTGAAEFRRQLEDPGLWAFAFLDGEQTVRGFFTARPFVGKAANANANELRVYEPIAENPEAFRALLVFLRALSDQFRAIVLETQDDAFHLLLGDPRDESGRIVHPPAYHETNRQGAGVMYRVLDVPRALEAVGAGGNRGSRSGWASLRVRDALVPENSEAFDVAVEGDSAGHGAVASLEAAEFASLVVGSVRFRTLYDYGLVSVTNAAAVEPLDRLFLAERPPLCTTHF